MVSIPVTLKENPLGWWGALVGRFPEIMFALQRARPCELAFVVFECHLVIRSSRWSEGPAATDSVSL